MISNLEQIYSDNAKGMKKSAIRELLKLTQKPEIISFAGGLPSPTTFPVEDLKRIFNKVMDGNAASALQYGATEGDTDLRKALTKSYQNDGMDITEENVLITTASQQGLDLLAKVFVNRGDKVIVGLPSYLGGLQAFNAYGADMIGVKLDDHGMRADKLEETLARLDKEGTKPKFIYTIPDFQNPAGITMPNERREEIIRIAKKYDVLLVEDSPYREIRFEGEHQKRMYALDNTGHVITLGTFSKIFVPGFRIGWMIAHKDIINKFVIAKQGVDLCTSPFVQRLAARYVMEGYFDKNIKKTIKSYHEKRDLMLKGFEENMPKEVSWTKPEGGLFLFLILPEYLDAADLFKKAVKQNVAFVVGSAFHCDGSGKNTMRINFSYVSKEQNVEGVKRLAKVIKEAIAEHK
ncbi:MAG TPA: PLP-dependent aminotransferase family protein [Candidatus Cloacimonetes bacterium]|nr:PLP-dependent aminotransferase family protein [Candidatus Cloacimonadota bacterium]